MFRTIDLHQLAQALTPSARRVRGSKPVTAVDPQSIRDHSIA